MSRPSPSEPDAAFLADRNRASFAKLAGPAG